MIDNFERAFSARVAGCRGTCACGREFWDSYNSGYDWDDGELDRLEADPKATGLNYAVEYVEFEGSQFVADCDCWKKRGTRIMEFIDHHAEAIADYLNAEAADLRRAAARAPVVEHGIVSDGPIGHNLRPSGPVNRTIHEGCSDCVRTQGHCRKHGLLVSLTERPKTWTQRVRECLVFLGILSNVVETKPTRRRGDDDATRTT